MTRDEAIAIILRRHENGGSWEERSIDVLVALGILNLEDPKSPEEKLTAALERTNIGSRGETVLRAIEAAGLKLTEK